MAFSVPKCFYNNNIREVGTTLPFGEEEDASALECGSAAFQIPRNIMPADLLKGAFTNEEQSDVHIRLLHGTTTLGFVFQGGVVLAVDSRASMGSFVGSQTVKKAIPITRHIMGTMAGGAADCQFWERHLGRMCRLHELRNKERISVAAASRLLSNILHSYRGMGLSMGTMVAGWDKTGPNLYYVDSEGLRVKNDKFSVGSGSPYAFGVLDTGYRFDMSTDEAFDVARRAIFHATYRDSYSGGFVSVFHIKADGWHMISRDDVKDLYARYLPEGICVAAAGNGL